VTLPDGTTKDVPMPLSESEFLHPEEGYHMPNSSFHQITTDTGTDLLTRRYAADPNVTVFRDVKIEWDNPELLPHVPDICVVMGIQNKGAERTSFVVAREGARPCLVIEVVSPKYRKADRETKVEEYELAGVQEYVIIDRLVRREQTTYELLGYRLAQGRYRPIAPDEHGRTLCRTVGLYLFMQDGQLVMEDAETGERLLTAREWELQTKDERAAREAAEARARLAEQRTLEAKQYTVEMLDEIADLKAKLAALEAALKPRE
jgi:Uma2 family endonuclease